MAAESRVCGFTWQRTWMFGRLYHTFGRSRASSLVRIAALKERFPTELAGADRLRQGYGGSAKANAKAGAPACEGAFMNWLLYLGGGGVLGGGVRGEVPPGAGKP